MNTNINWDGHMFTTAAPWPYSVKKYGSRSGKHIMPV